MTNTDLLDRYNEWRELRDSGMSLAAIGARYGVSKQAVHERLRKGPPMTGGRTPTLDLDLTPCTHPGRPSHARGLCMTCYMRAYRKAKRTAA